MRNKKNKNIGIIAVFAIILSVVTVMNTILVFNMTSKQTMDEGEYQISSISGELEATISDAKNQTMQIALNAMQYLSNRAELEAFIVDSKKELAENSNGMCYNLYIAGKDWDIIPDLEKPEGFVATERTWYKGAIANHGEVYVTSPYVDAWTGNICYSIAIDMGDSDTVLGVDYTVDNIQKYILQISESGTQKAIIVTEDGIIAGYSDETKIGQNLSNELPEYSGVITKAKHSEGVITAKLRGRLMPDYVFATRSSSGLYLIVSENAWELYKNSYIQLALTIILSVALFVIIFLLYLNSKRNQAKAEEALTSKDEFLAHIANELRSPLKNIINSASDRDLVHSENFEQEIKKIGTAGKELSDMLEQIVSYSAIVQSEKTEEEFTAGNQRKISWKFRNTIVAVLVVIMTFGCYVNISTTYKWGNLSMINQAQDYENQLSDWINTQKSILDMFCSLISTNPDMLNDYDYTIDYLNRITLQYPEISVTYMTNPEFEHTVMMNNGWEPDESWHVEERQWYIDTINSQDGWSISAPYYDEQTGLYCITMSESVYDDKTHEFLGNFGIDFYMDKLIDILGASYSDDGYAFLVDADGDIINHPYGEYQMTEEKITNVANLAYSKSVNDKDIATFKDYDNSYKLVVYNKNDLSGFSVYVVRNVWTIYGQVIIYSILFIGVFAACLIIIYKIITNLIRLQEKSNDALKSAADAAIAAGNAKSQFLAQMSHEIRTPINAVLGMNEMILRENDNADIEEYARNIQSAGNTLLTLINSILDFSKIEDGKMEIIPVNYDTASMVNDLVNTIQERAHSKNLELIVEINENLPAKLYGDDVRIRQVITNLLTNAVKYTEKGSVTFAIYEESRTDDEIILKVEVRDTGIGIREEDREKLFESFQRLDEKRNRNIEGTGLGISIVTKLLKMMDSKLTVDSVYGEGSTFGFVIAQKIVDGEPIGNYEERLELSQKKRNDETYLYAPEAKILVTDDNEMNIKVIKNLLKRNGFVPDTAISGYEAIEMVKEKSYDIIFLDHMMPKLDGIETLHLMQQQGLIAEGTVVIALTANAIVGARDEYLAAGFDDYLTKPVEISKMEEMLAIYLPEKMVSYKSNNEKTKSTKEEPKAATIAAEVALDGELSLDKLKTICPQLNTQNGISYCMNDLEFYIEVIKTFVTDNKTDILNDLFNKEDYEDYRITVHALKSTAKTIGLEELAEHARLLEMAVKENNIDYIKNNHAALIEEYQNLLAVLAKIA